MSKILVANWKSNPQNIKSAIKLAKAIDGKNIVIAPPSPFLEAVRKVIKKSTLGAQNVFWADGPYTGEISAEDLKALKVKYVIIGHSERRKNLKETDRMINLKVKESVKSGLRVILCVGEPFSIRKRGVQSAKSFIGKQLTKDLSGISKKNSRLLIVAYEPVWSISTERGSKPDTPEDAALMIDFIRNWLRSKGFSKNQVIYGGSVNKNNAARFLRQKGISGALVGQTSLRPLEFKKIKSSII
jgi:triosephosphate isomerase (TIM)